MEENLLELIENFKRNKGLFEKYNEASIKNAVILRVLKVLGWDPFNPKEVYPEYSIRDNRVDYALRHNDKNVVFIEVKKASEDLGKYQEQLLKYAFQEGVKLAILTNGISWWFYLPLREGSWEQRKFYTIEIYDQESNKIVKSFVDFLSKDNIISGKAIDNAENIYKSKQRKSLIEETLPKAWQKIITEPDDILVELIAETTERLCGYKPENDTVEQFLKTLVEPSLNLTDTRKLLGQEKMSSVSKKYLQDYTWRSIKSFTFKGRRYPVNTWKDLLVNLLNIIFGDKSEQFDRVFALRGPRKPYFSKNKGDLRAPRRIANSEIYVETNFNANKIVEISKQLLTIFGYQESDLTIEVE